ncbi:hypothetical protein CCUS01_12218 [Colletotrichum cuscutae]|uniref:Uncharacterized protein n=1 Tax=Colletotrichum cuscutae TaxID=1209917 RepID=A0AAI9XEQ0_9PEZI|nr:hypothetical protein CCUS01_12218 [Colletotrichum cuscutae]
MPSQDHRNIHHVKDKKPEINEGSNPSITLQPPTTQGFYQQRLSWVNHSLPRE